MQISTATSSDLDGAVACLTAAFAADPLTGFLLDAGSGYQDRVAQFFSLLMRARIALRMPVLVARDGARVYGAAMGYTTVAPSWASGLAEEWDLFEKSIAGLTDRMAVYEGIAAKGRPTAPHYYLGVIGVEPDSHGRGIGKQLLTAFCNLSDTDRLSSGVFLETAQPSNVGFYESAGFAETCSGRLGTANLWCMYRRTSSDCA